MPFIDAIVKTPKVTLILFPEINFLFSPFPFKNPLLKIWYKVPRRVPKRHGT